MKHRRSQLLNSGKIALVLWLAIGLIDSAKAVPTNSQQPKEQGWIISQSSSFAGTIYSELTAHRLKMTLQRLGLTILVQAPSWHAFIFNDNSKSFVDLPYNQWQTKLALSSDSKLRNGKGQLTLATSATGKTTNIAGFKASECWIEKKSIGDSQLPPEKRTQLWIATDIKAPPQITQIFCSHLGVPVHKGIPLRVCSNNNGRVTRVLDTTNIQRAHIPASEFQAPVGYKKVKDEMALLLDVSEDDTEDLLALPDQTHRTPTSPTKN